MEHLCWVIAVFVGVCVGVSLGAEIHLEASPGTIHPVLTKELTVKCSVRQAGTGTISANAIISRDSTIAPASTTAAQVAPGDFPFLRADVTHMTSIIISRQHEKSGENQTVATISSYDPPATYVDADMISVRGQTVEKSDAEEKGFLEVTWKYPGESQAGQYKCEVFALNTKYYIEYMATSTEVKFSEPTLKDLTRYVTDNDKYITELRQQLDHVTSQNAHLQAQLDNQTQEVDKDLQTVKQDIQDLQALTANTTSKDIQTGSETCSSMSTQHSVRFPVPFSSRPTIFLAVSGFRGGSTSSRINPSAYSISQTGFTLTCGASYTDSATISWIAMA